MKKTVLAIALTLATPSSYATSGMSNEGKQVKAKLIQTIKQSIAKKGVCKTVRLNPGSVKRSQLSIAIREVRPGVNPYIAISTTVIKWRYLYKGTIEGGCAKLEGLGHHK